MEIKDLIEAVHWGLLFIVPGTAILFSVRTSIEDAATAVVGALAVSYVYHAVIGLLLLRFGWFDDTVLALAVLGPAVTVLSLRRGVVVASARAWWQKRSSLLLPGLVAVAVAGAVILTPRWTFLIATHMDAGNYELYGNHFWRTGHLYLYAGDLIADGVPVGWIRFENTWFFDGAVGRPAFFYAYPVLLGVTKSTFDSFAVTWVFNGLVASSTAFALVVLGRRFTNSWWSVAVVLPVIATPLYYYYSKQVMSEGLALFALTAALIWVLGPQDRGFLPACIVVGGSVALLLLTKIDMVVPVVLLGGAIAYVALLRDGDHVPTGAIMGMAGGFIVAAALNSWLVADRYLAKLSPSTFVPALERTAFAGDGMVLILAVAVAVVMVVAYRSGGGGSPSGTRNTILVVTGWLVVAAWVAFAAWNLCVRPESGSLANNHDALNLIRLLDVFSPVAIGVLVLGSPALMSCRGLHRWVGLALIVALALVILRSGHSRSEVWWMRRYIATLLPVSVIVAAAGGAWVQERIRDNWRPFAVGSAVTVFVLASVVQAVGMRPLFAHEVNSNAPSRLNAALANIPDELPLVVVDDGGRHELLVQGLGNILRSLREPTTLLDVPLADLPQAVDLLGSRTVLVMSSRRLDDVSLTSGDLSLVYQGVYAIQYENWLGEIAENPARESPEPFYVYRLEPVVA